jgi:hypothetical protein
MAAASAQEYGHDNTSVEGVFLKTTTYVDPLVVYALRLKVESINKRYGDDVGFDEEVRLSSSYTLNDTHPRYSQIAHITIEYLINKDSDFEVFDTAEPIYQFSAGLNEVPPTRVLTGNQLLQCANKLENEEGFVQLAMRVTAWDRSKSIIGYDTIGYDSEEEVKVEVSDKEPDGEPTVSKVSRSLNAAGFTEKPSSHTFVAFNKPSESLHWSPEQDSAKVESSLPSVGGADFDGVNVAGGQNWIIIKSDPQPVAIPTFSPDGGTYDAALSVTVSCETDGAVIHYTTDGVDPTEGDPVVTNGGAVSIDNSLMLKAKAFKSGVPASEVKSAVYEVAEQNFVISGVISYSGYQTGTFYVWAFDAVSGITGETIGQEIYTWDLNDSTKEFSILVPPGDYGLAAYIDGSEGIEMTTDDWEAKGSYTSEIIVITDTDDTVSRDFTLIDLMNTAGDEFAYYTQWKEDNNWTNIGGMDEDPDKDGYSNLQEYVNRHNPDATLNAYDPTIEDEPGGRGYIGMSAVRRHSAWYLPDSDFEIDIEIRYPGELNALAITETIPDNWTFISVDGDDAPAFSPNQGDTGTLEFFWLSIPETPIDFSYRVAVPEDSSDEQIFEGQVSYRRLAGELSIPMEETEVELRSYHMGDYNPEDWTINLSELLRVIQFYNVGSYHCDPAGEDRYEPGAGDQDCIPHDADYNPQDWSITLSELLRMIQFYNVGAYHVDLSGEDGFAAGFEQ